MIRYLRGVLYMKVRNQLILDVQGVGYNVYALPSALASTTVGDSCEVHISESIREDAHELYGFLAVSERDMFELLRKVSGVGPKAALGILSFYTPHEITQLVTQGESAKLSLVPGIGKKSAEKIVLELRDKAKAHESLAQDPELEETITALEALGYSRYEISQVLPKIPGSLTKSNDRITWVLRHLAS